MDETISDCMEAENNSDWMEADEVHHEDEDGVDELNELTFGIELCKLPWCTHS